MCLVHGLLLQNSLFESMLNRFYDWFLIDIFGNLLSLKRGFFTVSHRVKVTDICLWFYLFRLFLPWIRSTVHLWPFGTRLPWRYHFDPSSRWHSWWLLRVYISFQYGTSSMLSFSLNCISSLSVVDPIAYNFDPEACDSIWLCAFFPTLCFLSEIVSFLFLLLFEHKSNYKITITIT